MLKQRTKKLLAKVLSLIVMGAISFSDISVYAAEIKVTARSVGNHLAEISGYTSEEKMNVTISIYAEDKSASDLILGEDNADIMVYQNQIQSGEDNSFQFLVQFKNAGDYTYYLNIDGEGRADGSVYSIDESVFHSLLESLIRDIKNSVKDVDDVETFILEHATKMNPDKSGLIADDKEIAKYMYNTLKETEISANQDAIREFVTMYDFCTALTAFYNGEIAIIFDYAQNFNLDNSDIAEFYKNSYVTDSLAEKVSDALRAEKPDSMQDFYDSLTEEFILAVIEKPDGVANVKEIVDAFAEIIGIVPEDGFARYNRLAGNAYSDLAAVAQAYNQDTAGGNGGGSSSGHGSTGGGGGTILNQNKTPGVTVSDDYLPQNTVTPSPVNIYGDMDSAKWAEAYIVALTEQGIISGKGDGRFCPNDNITREEFAKLLTLVFAPDVQLADIAFTDVPKDSWCYEYVAKAFTAGIIKGYSSTEFGYQKEITREDMAVMAARAAAITEEESAEASFDDFAQVSDYAKNSVAAMNRMGILTGTNDMFYPKAFATRAEAAKVIYLLWQDM